MLKSIQITATLSLLAFALVVIGLTIQNLWGVFFCLLGVTSAAFAGQEYLLIKNKINWTRNYVMREHQKGRTIDEGIYIAMGYQDVDTWLKEAEEELEAAQAVVARAEQRMGNVGAPN